MQTLKAWRKGCMCIYVNLRRQRESESLHHLLNTARRVCTDYLLTLVPTAGGCRGREKSMTVVAIDQRYSFGKDHTLYFHPA